MSDKGEGANRVQHLGSTEEKGIAQDVIVPVLQEAKDVLVPIATGYAGGLASRPKDPPDQE